MAHSTRTSRARRSLGIAVIVNAIIGIALGLIALFWPDRTLVVIATFFGIALVVAGLMRVVAALINDSLTRPDRIVLGAVGLALIVLGVLVIAQPGASLVFLAVLIGIGWIAGGLRDLYFGWRAATGPTRTLALVAGAIQVIGGIVMIALPQAGLAAFVVLAAILLIVISCATLLTMPARRAARRTR